jgi:hypothetical protein
MPCGAVRGLGLGQAYSWGIGPILRIWWRPRWWLGRLRQEN